jgi:aspartyl-tRNA(Asn)/glutamyl-tRNA(Gln) amidotransferase subunit B
MKYLFTIGLEVHVQLKTRSKMFCACPTGPGAPPNTQVCPVCLGYPGTLPVMNGEAIRLTAMTGLMLGCTISPYCKFDRKNYFYPDMPKNYQISQYDKPLCLDGGVEIDAGGRFKTVRLTRIHLEEDVGKCIHHGRRSGVDCNRAGVPLMEIVSEPDMETPEEALAFLVALKQMLLYLGVSDCNLEEGNLRCDVNSSVRPEGQVELGTKVEIKNLNTFKGVHQSLHFERNRQLEAIRTGEKIVQETRRWDSELGATYTMRSKEQAHDYRYFPEPDLMPVALPAERVEAWRAALPELPRQKRQRFVSQYGLPEYDAGVLAAQKAVADYFEEAARGSDTPKMISNWVMTEMLRLLSEREMEIGQVKVTPAALRDLAALASRGAINSNTAKEVFAILFEQGGDPAAVVAERGWGQVSDADSIGALADQVIAENPKSVEDYRGGKAAALKFLIGQVMRLSRGKANPQMATEKLVQRLGGPDGTPAGSVQ